jgi:hypothetical protein
MKKFLRYRGIDVVPVKKYLKNFKSTGKELVEYRRKSF